jgi:PAS domain S-box-containing protein
MGGREIQVLVIEHSPSDAALLTQMFGNFKKVSCRITTVTDMNSAEKILGTDSFDVIFQEMNLPDSVSLDNIAKINKLRNITPVILMTMDAGQEGILKSLNIGAQNYIIIGEETAVSLERAVMYSIECEKNIVELRGARRIQDEIINNSPVMMFVLDEKGMVTLSNYKSFSAGGSKGDAFVCVNSELNMVGCSNSDECAGCPITTTVKDVLKTGVSVHRKEIKYAVTKDGKNEDKYLLISAGKTTINGGFNVLVSVEDVTHLKESERRIKESEQKFSSLFFSSSAGILLARISDGKIIEANKALEEKFGYKRSEVIGMTAVELDIWENNEIRDNVLKNIFNGLNITGVELNFRNKSGQLVPCLYSASPLIMNGELHVVSTVIDLTEQKKFQRERESNEEKFKGAFEQSAMGMAFIDFDGRFIEVNQRYCDILGYSKDELEGKRFEDITYPDSIENDLIAISAMMKGTLAIYKTEKRYIKKDGRSLVWAELTVSLARDKDKKPKYFVAVIEDIAEKKETKERWQAFSNSVDSCFMLFDTDLKLEAANPAAYKYYETLTGQLLKLNTSAPEVLQHVEDDAMLNTLIDAVKTGDASIVDEYKFIFPGLEERYYSIKAFRVGSGLGLIMTNTTDLKRSEFALKSSYEKLMEIDKLKSNFISIVSHELRTPLTIIKGFTAFLSREKSGPINAIQKEYLNTVEENTNRLARIINDMVDMSKIERGTFVIEKEKWDMVYIMGELFESMRGVVVENGLELKKEFEVDAAFCSVDRGRIFQAISNMINNSIRFSETGGYITLGLQMASPDNVPERFEKNFLKDKIYYFISVKDQGVGIEKNNLEKVFDRFYQVENANVRIHSGSGLGLSIAKNIAEAHGGFIWAESEGIGKGAKICMVIPA